MIETLKEEAQGRLGERLAFSPLNGGSSNLSFQGKGEDGKKYVVKFQRHVPGLEVQRRLREYLDRRDQDHPRLILAFPSRRMPEAYLTVSEWMEGSPLLLEGESMTLSELRKRAQQAAGTVKRLHRVSLSDLPDKSIWEQDSGQDAARALLASTKEDFPYREQFFRAVQEGMDHISSPRGIVHLDLRPDNMVFSDDACRLMDMETLSVDHIWADFSYAVEINFPKERVFWLLFLDSYFDGGIPLEFWKETREHVLIKFLSLLRLDRKTGNPGRQYALAEKIYRDYDGFQSYEPLWMKETMAALGSQG